MDTNNKNPRTLLSLALLASLSATALFVASAEEPSTSDEAIVATTTKAVPASLDTPPVIELPPTTTLAGDPAVDADKAMSEEAPLEPGDYTWHPETSPAGEVVILVSLPKQEMNVYRNGVRIGRSSVSTGKPGHDTPTGVFPILQKKRMHHSNLYDDAPMPYMQRLTWDGVALHSGRNPGYPASHGCIRLPDGFAARLYEVTERGDTTVVVADTAMLGGEVFSPGEFAPTRLLALAASADDAQAE